MGVTGVGEIPIAARWRILCGSNSTRYPTHAGYQMRRGLSASLRAQRSNPWLDAAIDGLLRCARNDGGYGFAFSRRDPPEVCMNLSPPSKSEGAGNAGCLLH